MNVQKGSCDHEIHKRADRSARKRSAEEACGKQCCINQAGGWITAKWQSAMFDAVDDLLIAKLIIACTTPRHSQSESKLEMTSRTK